VPIAVRSERISSVATWIRDRRRLSRRLKCSTALFDQGRNNFGPSMCRPRLRSERTGFYLGHLRRGNRRGSWRRQSLHGVHDVEGCFDAIRKLCQTCIDKDLFPKVVEQFPGFTPKPIDIGCQHRIVRFRTKVGGSAEDQIFCKTRAGKLQLNSPEREAHSLAIQTKLLLEDRQHLPIHCADADARRPSALLLAARGLNNGRLQDAR
jgi:hypothetical protein